MTCPPPFSPPGLAIPLAGTIIDFALVFWIHGRALNVLAGVGPGERRIGVAPLSHVRPASPMLSSCFPSEPCVPCPCQVAAAGAFAGFAGSVLFTPIDLVKNRLQLQQGRPGSSPELYKGPWDVIRRSVKAEGLGVMYRGHSATVAMEVRTRRRACVMLCVC